MKAIVQEGSGSADVLRLREVERPVLTDDRVLLRVRAASVNALDWHTVQGGAMLRVVSFLMRSRSFPVRGADVAGVVEAVGKNVTRLRPGDEVFGTARGTFAEYALGRENGLVPKPPQLSFEQAGAVGVAAITALQGLRDRGQVKPGQRVLINGAGGGVGTYAVQIAKALGAHVTAVTSTRNLDLIRGLGPDELIDYTKEDFTRRAQKYDVIFDVAANRSFGTLRRALEPNGRIVIVGAAKKNMFSVMARALIGIARARMGTKWLVPLLAAVNQKDLLVLKEYIEAGKVCPLIDRQYPLSETADAVRYLGSGQARAKVVINVS